ncbi:MAG: CPBP family intramembrane metalloprotease domain-containing protein [Alkalinema sp. RU_4_3]|nr:CPBP family intramembrane metalloprotease domain-containing protein [Alkalinema sp. RU_4_3]
MKRVKAGWNTVGWQRIAAIALATVLSFATLTLALEPHYRITQQAPFNQVSHYPLRQTLGDRYRPTGNWVGRLILPEASGDTSDWVWMKVYHAPTLNQSLIGQKVRLEWRSTEATQQYVAAVTKDVRFGAAVAESQRKGNLHPERLDGRSQVGPLQSLAGAHPEDDVLVTLDEAMVVRVGEQPRLQIERDPVIEAGRFYGLVKVLSTIDQANFVPKDCPGSKPCPSELFRVQHYNAKTQTFDGEIDTVRIPQQPRDAINLFSSTPRDLAIASSGQAGWYIYGAQDKDGLFTVQALKPRVLFQLSPQTTITDQTQGLDYLKNLYWRNTEKHAGQIKSILINPQKSEETWAIGSQAVFMHLFGGRGGPQGEKPMLGTVTGHFSYGLAQVVQEPLANELQWDLRYQQVYATNMEGIIAGTNSWAAYMGDLRRGWAATRPVSDVLVKLDLVEDYDFGGNLLISPLQEFSRQLQVISARYRIGDGSGTAVVTPATSCVQDSNQALFATVQQIRKTVAESSAIQAWLKANPQSPTAERFRRLVLFGDEVERQLMPLGIVREDWKTNSEALSGTEIRDRTFRRASYEGLDNVLAALTSWRTMLPRQAQDELSTLFLNRGAKLWLLQTNQVGGHNPDVFPIAPTQLFGQWAIPGTSIALVSVLLIRLLGSISIPHGLDWLIALGALGLYGAIAIPYGFSRGFLKWARWEVPKPKKLTIQLFFMPALVEELLFRVLLLPGPLATTWWVWGGWAIAGIVLFVLYHPLNARTFYPAGNPTFLEGHFLRLAGLLGVVCTAVYALTSSLLLITLIHWVVVWIWLSRMGGLGRLGKDNDRS